MRRELFLRITTAIENANTYFVQRPDACGRPGLSPLQKVTAAVRILAYGCSADQTDEYIKIGRSTSIETLKEFCTTVIGLFEEQYLRSPNAADTARLLQQGEARGFPGMLGSLGCMHWDWKNCPVGWHGTHKGRSHTPSLILEAVASRDLWIWHSFFGMAGGHNDINVLDHSPLFDRILHGRDVQTDYVVNGRHSSLGYYLTDGIYPKYATFVQAINPPITAKERLFTKRHEAARKDVERAFGVLQIKWGITQGPVQYWDRVDLGKIMKTCIILHNMIIEDERDMADPTWAPPIDEDISPQPLGRQHSVVMALISSRLTRIRNRSINETLRRDLMDHMWNLYGDEEE